MSKVGRPKKNRLPQELQRKIEALEGETNEKKIKELKKFMKKEAEICGALQSNGAVCVKKPWVREGGSTNGRCVTHGGSKELSKDPERRERQLANLNPKARLVHGMYSQEFKEKLTKEEVNFYNEMVDWFTESYPEDIDPINMSLLHRYGMNTIKTMRQESTDFLKESRSQNSFERMMINFANELGLNKKYRDSKENKVNKQNADIALLFQNDSDKR